MPEGPIVGIHSGAANLDPSVFTDAASYQPGRASAQQLLTSGRGEHACLAVKAAHTMLVAAIQELVASLDAPRRLEGPAPRARHLFHGPSGVSIARRS